MLSYLRRCMLCIAIFLIFPSLTFGQSATKQEPFAEAAYDFVVVAKMIIVQAVVAGVEGNFILDTGSPELILNSAHFRSLRETSTIHNMTGQANATTVLHVPFAWGPLQIRSKRAFVADLTRLEHGRNFNIHGIIGYSILRDYEVQIDYPAHRITLFTLDKRGNYLDPAMDLPEHHTIAMQMTGHLPCVRAAIGVQELRLAIDTGAGLNIMSNHLEAGFAAFLTDERDLSLSGLSQSTHRSHASLAHGLSIGNFPCPPMRTSFANLTALNDELGPGRIDGLIGYEFLKQRVTSLNYRKKEFTVWLSAGLPAQTDAID